MDKYELPPGFRFHPTDEELIVYYLRNQIMSLPCPSPIIPQLNIYQFDPWQLPGKSELSEREWYFFTPRARKYPNGVRPNRATASGYWKATGTDKAIFSSSKNIGLKKALVFYNGRPPKGSKTDWIMHEYRLTTNPNTPFKASASIALDEWVLCRIYLKRQTRQNSEMPTPMEYIVEAPKLPRSCSLAHLLELDNSGFGFIDDLFSGVDGTAGDLVEDAVSDKVALNHGVLFGNQIHMDAIF